LTEKPSETTLPAPEVNLPALVDSPELTNFDLAKLAREIAMNIKPLDTVLEIFKITPAQYEKIKVHPFFARALDQFTIEWNSAKSVHDRIRIESAIILEDAMPNLAGRMAKSDETLGAVIEAGKLLHKMSGMETERASGNPGDKFTITINLGEDTKLKFSKDITPAKPLTDESQNEQSEDSIL
jgi:hypothetical protein